MVKIKNKDGVEIYDSRLSASKQFDEADLRNADLSGMSLEGRDFSDANLSGATLEGGDFYWANFFRAVLRDASLRGGVFTGCVFDDADLSGADLTHASFGRDNLGGSTHLEGANLSRCKIEGTIFEGALYNCRTRLPEGFDPKAHGMKLVDLDVPEDQELNDVADARAGQPVHRIALEDL